MGFENQNHTHWTVVGYQLLQTISAYASGSQPHDHMLSGGSAFQSDAQTANHNHTITVATAAAATATTAHENLPPYQTINYMIRY